MTAIPGLRGREFSSRQRRQRERRGALIRAAMGSRSTALANIVAAVHKDGTLTRFSLPERNRELRRNRLHGGSLRRAERSRSFAATATLYFSDPEYQAPAGRAPVGATRVYRLTPAGEVSAFDDTVRQSERDHALAR